MNNLSYYALPAEAPLDIQAGSRRTDEAPLVVNCAGNFETRFAFQTDNTVGREDYYLMLILNGALRVARGEDEVLSPSGTLLMFPPHYHYRYAYDGNEPLRYLWVHFSGSHVEDYLARFGLAELPLRQICSVTGEALSIFEDMFSEFRVGGALRDAALGCHLERLLLALAMDDHTRQESAKPCSLTRSLEYIDAHYTEAFAVTVLAKLERLSYSRYHDVFAAEMGCPPRQYIIRKRMEHACELLLGTDMGIAQIGVQVGYDDPSFFSKAFKKELGLSPLDYRRQNG